MSKNEYSLIGEAEDDILNSPGPSWCVLCRANHEPCLDDDEIDVFDELGLWDDEDDDEDWEDEYDG